MIAASKTRAIQLARDIIAKNPIYLDTETTGTGTTAEIIEICIIDDDSKTLINTLVKPLSLIPHDSIRIHGITNTMVQNAPAWPTVWSEVQEIIRERLVAVYNADFDLRMLRQTNKRHNLIWTTSPETDFTCIMKLYAQFIGDWNPTYRNYRWHSLERAGVQSNISIENSHRACTDTQLARSILHYMSNQEI